MIYKKILFFAKKAVLNSFRLMHQLAQLQKIDNLECIGECYATTRFKLLPKIRNYFSYSNGVSVRGISFDNIDRDVFGGALERSVMSDEFSVNTFSKILKSRYDYEKGISAGDILELESSHILHNYPAWCIVLPWEKSDIDIIYQQYPSDLLQNRKGNFLEFTSGNREYVLDRVYSYEAAESQAYQTKKLFESISTNGIINSDSLPKVVILRKGGKWKWMMGGQGNHRAYLFKLLGYRYLYAEINQFVDVSNVESWFNVKNGLYTRSEAENIFNKVMDSQIVVRGII